MSGDPSMSYEIGKKLGDRVVEMGADKFAIVGERRLKNGTDNR